MKNIALTVPKGCFFAGILLVILFPFLFPSLKEMQPGLGLLLGILLAAFLGNPFEEKTKKLAPKLLSYAVMGLGFGMNFLSVVKAGFYGTGYTVAGIALTFLLGWILSMMLKNENKATLLISTGTAICGGSAIAAVAPVIRARDQDITVAMGTVFILNALGLILFPKLGHYFQLSQKEFGLWCALAIHDTSSVVGATIQYGQEALDMGTTIKMARALWIIPLTFLMATLHHLPDGKGVDRPKIKKPWFILGLLVAAALTTWVPGMEGPAVYLKGAAKQMLVLTLFLIGINLNPKMIREIGFRPLFHGGILWISVAFLSLAAIRSGLFTA